VYIKAYQKYGKHKEYECIFTCTVNICRLNLGKLIKCYTNFKVCLHEDLLPFQIRIFHYEKFCTHVTRTSVFYSPSGKFPNRCRNKSPYQCQYFCRKFKNRQGSNWAMQDFYWHWCLRPNFYLFYKFLNYGTYQPNKRKNVVVASEFCCRIRSRFRSSSKTSRCRMRPIVGATVATILMSLATLLACFTSYVYIAQRVDQIVFEVDKDSQEFQVS